MVTEVKYKLEIDGWGGVTILPGNIDPYWVESVKLVDPVIFPITSYSRAVV